MEKLLTINNFETRSEFKVVRSKLRSNYRNGFIAHKKYVELLNEAKTRSKELNLK